MIIVLDASAALEIALNRESGEIFRGELKKSDLVISPDIFPSEITNAFWKYACFSKLDIEKCKEGINYCINLVDDYIQTKTICTEVFTESVISAHSAYDIFYLIVARRNGALLLTKDKKLKKKAKELNIGIIKE
jgi:predicted nucleic acid-binding protein